MADPVSVPWITQVHREPVEVVLAAVVRAARDASHWDLDVAHQGGSATITWSRQDDIGALWHLRAVLSTTVSRPRVTTLRMYGQRR